MKKFLRLLSILFLGSIFVIGCGGGSSSTDTNNIDNISSDTSETILLKRGESTTTHQGDTVKALTDDTKLNIVTNAETGDSKVTVQNGEALVTKY